MSNTFSIIIAVVIVIIVVILVVLMNKKSSDENFTAEVTADNSNTCYNSQSSCDTACKGWYYKPGPAGSVGTCIIGAPCEPGDTNCYATELGCKDNLVGYRNVDNCATGAPCRWYEANGDSNNCHTTQQNCLDTTRYRFDATNGCTKGGYCYTGSGNCYISLDECNTVSRTNSIGYGCQSGRCNASCSQSAVYGSPDIGVGSSVLFTTPASYTGYCKDAPDNTDKVQIYGTVVSMSTGASGPTARILPDVVKTSGPVTVSGRCQSPEGVRYWARNSNKIKYYYSDSVKQNKLIADYWGTYNPSNLPASISPVDPSLAILQNIPIDQLTLANTPDIIQ